MASRRDPVLADDAGHHHPAVLGQRAPGSAGGVGEVGPPPPGQGRRSPRSDRAADRGGCQGPWPRGCQAGCWPGPPGARSRRRRRSGKGRSAPLNGPLRARPAPSGHRPHFRLPHPHPGTRRRPRRAVAAPRPLASAEGQRWSPSPSAPGARSHGRGTPAPPTSRLLPPESCALTARHDCPPAFTRLVGFVVTCAMTSVRRGRKRVRLRRKRPPRAGGSVRVMMQCGP